MRPMAHSIVLEYECDLVCIDDISSRDLLEASHFFASPFADWNSIRLDRAPIRVEVDTRLMDKGRSMMQSNKWSRTGHDNVDHIAGA